MADTSVGIALNLAVKGLANIDICSASMKKLALSIKGAGKQARYLMKELKQIKANNLKLDGIKKQMDGFKSQFMERAATAVSLALPVKFAIDFESAMVDVKKYIEFESDEQFKQLGGEIKELSSSLGVGFDELAAIAASGGQQGLKADQIIDYTRLVSKLGVAFDMSGRDAGDAAAYVMNNFKLGIKELEKLGNQMNFLDDKMSMVKSSELFNILNRTSSNANLLGLSADSAAALGASLLSVGKAPEVASTALNSMYNALANLDGQDEKFHKALNKMGMDAQYLKNAIKKDAATAVQDFILAISNVKGDEQMGVLTDMFGKQFSDDLGSLVVNKDILNNAFNLIKQDSSKSELKLKTTKSSLERLTNAIKNLGVNIGSVLLPPLATLADALAKASNWLSDLTEKSPFLSKVISGLGVAIMGFAVILPTIGYAAAFVSSGLIRLKNVFLLLKIETALLTIKTKGFTAALWLKDKAMKALTATTKLLTSAMKALGKFIKGAFWVAGKALVLSYNVALNTLKFTAGAVSKAFKFLAIGIRAISAAMMANPLSLILGSIAVVAGIIITNWDKVKAWFIAFIEWLRPVWEPIIGGIKQIWREVGSFFGFIFDGWKAIFSGVAKFIAAVFQEPVEWIKGLFEPLFNWLAEKFSWVGSALDGIKSGVKTALGWVGLGGDEQSYDTPNGGFGSGGGLISSSFSHAAQYQAAAMTTNGSTINVNFSGDFNIATSSGKFDLAEFERQLVASVKRALRQDEMNAKNRSIIGQ
ncbi:TP901 family tail tape measure protein [Campylobacter hyointestinalis]|uniref:phage tail tape measure protein n=1 Tax=Campylobacter hyointestinalis TaxID=198 RepID=UPI000727507E|nr:phage tail tape measure protein [Campylobacter hyointestinalis]PPB55483.1 phage tail tape measure protein [Campylobacter hyointestinalis subsp. hyointestinalis]CUU82927.1 TP901 family tail tape measure protein [Campylobacter hyointestinalis]